MKRPENKGVCRAADDTVCTTMAISGKIYVVVAEVARELAFLLIAIRRILKTQHNIKRLESISIRVNELLLYQRFNLMQMDSCHYDREEGSRPGLEGRGGRIL